MPEYIDVDLTVVDASYKNPPIGDYLAQIESYEVRYNNADKTLRDIHFKFKILEGNAEGVGLPLSDYQNPNEDMGRIKMKNMADVCKLPYDARRIDIQPYVGQKLGVTVIHKPGRDAGTVFANISKYFVPKLNA